jgi:hypothetical protein
MNKKKRKKEKHRAIKKKIELLHLAGEELTKQSCR